MQNRHYIIKSESQEIILPKTSINASLYWGQQMAIESLEKGHEAGKVTAFKRSDPILENPYDGINRLQNSVHPPITRTTPAAEPKNVFRPFVSIFDQHRMNINLKRKFKRSKSKSLLRKSIAHVSSGMITPIDNPNMLFEAPSRENFENQGSNKTESIPVEENHMSLKEKARLHFRTLTPDTLHAKINAKANNLDNFFKEAGSKIQHGGEATFQLSLNYNYQKPKSVKGRANYMLTENSKDFELVRSRKSIDYMANPNVSQLLSSKKENKKPMPRLNSFSSFSPKILRRGERKSEKSAMLNSVEVESLDPDRVSSPIVGGQSVKGKEELKARNILVLQMPEKKEAPQNDLHRKFSGIIQRGSISSYQKTRDKSENRSTHEHSVSKCEEGEKQKKLKKTDSSTKQINQVDDVRISNSTFINQKFFKDMLTLKPKIVNLK